MIISANALIYVDQASRKTALPVNGWASRITDMPLQVLGPEEQECDMHLEGCHAAFVDVRTFFVITQDGFVHPVEIIMDGKTVTRLALGTAACSTSLPNIGSLSASLFGGSRDEYRAESWAMVVEGTDVELSGKRARLEEIQEMEWQFRYYSWNNRRANSPMVSPG